MMFDRFHAVFTLHVFLYLTCIRHRRLMPRLVSLPKTHHAPGFTRIKNGFQNSQNSAVYCTFLNF